MPLYDYRCESCGKEFTAALTLAEHKQGAVLCPGCGSKKVKQLISPFVAQTASKT
ncbi:MAG TPA: zinc ribbon domain-containing protein [Nitrospiria bacterium]